MEQHEARDGAASETIEEEPSEGATGSDTAFENDVVKPTLPVLKSEVAAQLQQDDVATDQEKATASSRKFPLGSVSFRRHTSTTYGGLFSFRGGPSASGGILSFRGDSGGGLLSFRSKPSRSMALSETLSTLQEMDFHTDEKIIEAAKTLSSFMVSYDKVERAAKLGAIPAIAAALADKYNDLSVAQHFLPALINRSGGDDEAGLLRALKMAQVDVVTTVGYILNNIVHEGQVCLCPRPVLLSIWPCTPMSAPLWACMRQCRRCLRPRTCVVTWRRAQLPTARSSP